MKINISHSDKARFDSLSIGEIFILGESDVCVKTDYETGEWNVWKFGSCDQYTINANTEVTIPREVTMEVIL